MKRRDYPVIEKGKPIITEGVAVPRRGRPLLGSKPMTNAERAQRLRDKEKGKAK